MVGRDVDHHQRCLWSASLPTKKIPYFHTMEFFTSTINSWKPLLTDDKLKLCVVHSLDWVVKTDKAKVHAFVIMPNHFHVLWTKLDANYDLGGRIKSYTGSQFREYLLHQDPSLLQQYTSTQEDREFHFWERRSRTIGIYNRQVAEQKVDYIHNNPLQEKWNLCQREEDYFYSSARFYLAGDLSFSFLSRYEDWI